MQSKDHTFISKQGINSVCLHCTHCMQ